MKRTSLLPMVLAGIFCVTIFTQCGEQTKKAANDAADTAEKMADDVEKAADGMADETKKMADDAAKTAEEMTGMDSKDGSLTFDEGTWAHSVLQGINSGNTTVFTLDQISYEGEDLSAEGAAQLDHLASILKANPNWSIEIQGHTEKADNAVGAGKKKVLSKTRAAWVQAKMNARGITGKQISSKGYGEEQLLEGLDPKDKKHRRITIALTKNDAEAA